MLIKVRAFPPCAAKEVKRLVLKNFKNCSGTEPEMLLCRQIEDRHLFIQWDLLRFHPRESGAGRGRKELLRLKNPEVGSNDRKRGIYMRCESMLRIAVLEEFTFESRTILIKSNIY